MRSSIPMVGELKAKQGDPVTPNVDVWYHRTSSKSAQKILDGSKPTVPFWGSSHPDGCAHKRGNVVIRFSLKSKDHEGISFEDHESRQTSLLRHGEWWIKVWKHANHLIQIDTAFQMKPIGWWNQPEDIVEDTGKQPPTV